MQYFGEGQHWQRWQVNGLLDRTRGDSLKQYASVVTALALRGAAVHKTPEGYRWTVSRKLNSLPADDIDRQLAYTYRNIQMSGDIVSAVIAGHWVPIFRIAKLNMGFAIRFDQEISRFQVTPLRSRHFNKLHSAVPTDVVLQKCTDAHRAVLFQCRADILHALDSSYPEMSYANIGDHIGSLAEIIAVTNDPHELTVAQTLQQINAVYWYGIR